MTASEYQMRPSAIFMQIRVESDLQIFQMFLSFFACTGKTRGFNVFMHSAVQSERNTTDVIFTLLSHSFLKRLGQTRVTQNRRTALLLQTFSSGNASESGFLYLYTSQFLNNIQQQKHF
jgi:hypothetical protein